MCKISVIMSTHNTPEEYLRASIESILSQTFKDFEFIIIDDGSTENDCKIIESYHDLRIKIIKNYVNCGLPFSLNSGIALASGKYIMRMDSDDIALPDRLEKQFSYMEQHKDVDISGAFAWRFGDKNGLLIPCRADTDINYLMYFKSRIIHPSVIMRRSFLTENNLKYNESFKRSQDYELWSRVMECGKISIAPVLAIKYRCHEKQATAAFADEQRAFGFNIYSRLIGKLGIELTYDKYDLHYCLVNAKPAKDVRQLLSWVKELKYANRKIGLLNKCKFEKELNYRLSINLIRNLKEGRYKASPKLLCEILNPKRFYDFLSSLVCEWFYLKKIKLNNRDVIDSYCKK